MNKKLEKRIYFCVLCKNLKFSFIVFYLFFGLNDDNSPLKLLTVCNNECTLSNVGLGEFGNDDTFLGDGYTTSDGVYIDELSILSFDFTGVENEVD